MTEYQVVLIDPLDPERQVPRGQPTIDREKALALFHQQAHVRATRPTTIRLLERQTTHWRVVDEADRPVIPILVPV